MIQTRWPVLGAPHALPAREGLDNLHPSLNGRLVQAERIDRPRLHSKTRIYQYGRDAMKVTKTIRNDQAGAQRFKRQWGDKLIAVRYRHDNSHDEVITTIEIEVDRRPAPQKDFCQRAHLATPRSEIVALAISFHENDLRLKVKQAGAKWSQIGKFWLTSRKTAISLGLKDRIVEGGADKCLDIDTSLMLVDGYI